MRNVSESRFRETSSSTEDNFNFLKLLENYYQNSLGTNVEKLANFPKYVPRQNLTYFLAKYELFKKILNVQGSIVECGVLFGEGLMAFAQFSAIFEHLNHQRKIIGFDTFTGIPETSIHDIGSTSEYAEKGAFATNAYDDLTTSISLYDKNRFLSHIPKIELIKGDACITIPKYLEDNPHTVVSLLYLDFDIYEPTKIAIKNFVPRMPKGSIIAFDELNSKKWIGETKALVDTLGIHNLKLERFNFDTEMCFAVLE